MIKKDLLNSTMSAISTANLPGPAFMQAAALGLQGSARTISSGGHNAVTMWRAACDYDSVEILISNAIIWASATTSETFPADGSTLLVEGTLWTPTFPYVETTRNFTNSFAVGATGGTLTSNAPGSTLEYCVFSSGEARWIKLTGSSTAVTWDAPLTATAASNPRTRAFTSTPITFGGNAAATLTGGQLSAVKTVVTGLNGKRGDPMYINWYVSKSGGGSFQLPANQPANWQDTLGVGLLEAFNDSVTNSKNTRFGSPPWYAIAGGTNQFRPIAVRAFNRANNTKVPVTIIGDSIGTFLGSWVQRFCHANYIPYVNLCKAGEASASFIAGSTVRQQAFSNGVAFCEMGRNAWSLSSMQTLWAFLRQKGYSRIIQVLPPPQTTSGTNNWSTEATQNPDTVTLGVNAQIRALVGTFGGPDAIIDTYTPCQGVDPQKWAGGYTDDGTHPNDTGVSAILAYAASQGYGNLFNL